jgi:hypothetical protein
MGIMNKLLLFLLLLPFGVSAQLIQKNTTYGMAFNRTGADTLFYLPVDTFTVPTVYRTYNFMARKATTLYIWNTSTFAWQAVSSGGGAAGWELTGNSGTTAGTNFIGTTDAVALVVKTNNTERARVLSGGNVGIGTSSPDSMLTVNGGLYANRGVRFTGMPATDTTVSLIGIKADGTAVVTTKSSLSNFYNSDGIMTGDRTVYGDNTTLIFNDFQGFEFFPTTGKGVKLNVNTDSIIVLTDSGAVAIRYLKQNAGTKSIRYDPSTGLLTYADTTTGGGSGVTTVATFGAGARLPGDTAAFTDSTIYGSFYNDGEDTLIITAMRIVMQGTNDTLTINVEWNDSLNTTGTKLKTAYAAANNNYTGNSYTSFDNTKIPPGNHVWCKSPTVIPGRRPTYLSVTLIGYKKRV